MRRLITSDAGDLPSNALPSDTAVQVGGAGASGTAKGSGNLWLQSPAGGATPASLGGGTAADIIVGLATIPAGAFDVAGRELIIRAMGNFAANGNSKTAKLIVNPTAPVLGAAVSGGTMIASTGAVTTSGSSWALDGEVIKVGANGSNTQNALNPRAQAGAAAAALTPAQALTLTESAPITVAVTINCATAATDASLWKFQGEFFN